MGAAAGGEGEAVRVLVVDDSPVDRRVVELLLRNHAAAFHVTTVDSGKKAMELLGLHNAQGKQRSIDMVLTDYCMPEMTGYDLLQAIKALGSANPIPVVVMSSENEPQRISRCLTAGAEDYIVKPLRKKDVQRLRNCSAVRPATKDAVAADDRRRSSVNAPAPPPRLDTAAKKATSEQRPRRLAGAGLAMASTVDLSHYLQFLFKFILLAYAVLCLTELLHRWSNGCFLSQLP
ncbi:two-component response regulator ORR2-like [Lolium rigidum]|uniref:two-component response regulator ORR2-like n=1 Tax=Lolium rigidum TaxID=89674 RepID=UPI001F5CBA04|nr:two-component response regulator ORR2-like [Lolium rigidum]